MSDTSSIFNSDNLANGQNRVTFPLLSCFDKPDYGKSFSEGGGVVDRTKTVLFPVVVREDEPEPQPSLPEPLQEVT